MPFQQVVLPLKPSDVHDAAPPAPPPLSVSLKGRFRPPPPLSAMRVDAPLLLALLPQQVDTPLQPSAANPPPLPQFLALPLQLDVPPLHPLSACAPYPLIPVLIQGRGKTPLLLSTIRTYVPLISALLLQKGVPLRQPSDELAPLPLISALLRQRVDPPFQPSDTIPPPLTQLSALPLQLDVPTLQPSDVHTAASTQLSILFQGQGEPPLLSSTLLAYVHLFSASLLRQGVSLRQPSPEPAPLPQLSA